MTWIIGRSIPFGYAIGLSDIRVTLGDGREIDCLQKIYEVGPVIALGFAGSVRIGFAMVERMRELLATAKRGQAWDPAAVADWWPMDARRVFEKSEESDRLGNCHLLMLAAHPTENTSEFDWPKCHVFRFESPGFKPVQAEPWEVVSIGSGTANDYYVQRLKEIEASEEIIQLATQSPGGGRLGLTNAVGKTLETPLPGISKNLHVCMVWRDRIEIGTNDRKMIGRTSSFDLSMPPVASSYSELMAMLRSLGNTVKGATCCAA